MVILKAKFSYILLVTSADIQFKLAWCFNLINVMVCMLAIKA